MEPVRFNIKDIKYKIAKPCQAKWQDMDDHGNYRHCHLCEKPVYDFSKMSEKEILEALGNPSISCIRVYKRPDGKIITKDCPVRFQDIKRSFFQGKFRLGFSLVFLFIFSTIGLARLGAFDSVFDSVFNNKMGSYVEELN